MADRTTRPDLDSAGLVEVTDGDIAAARAAWSAGRDGGAPPERVALLHRSYERLVRTQGRQVAEAFRSRHPR